MESSSSSENESDCMIVSFTEGDPCIIVDDDEPLIKRFKSDNDNNFHLRKIPGDGHCIANCFAVHFDEPLDRVLDRLDNEFRENISFYRDFSHFSEDEIKFYVFKYITEKSYNNDITDMFLCAFSRIYETKVVVRYTEENTADTIIGEEFKENTIYVNKEPDHYNLIEQMENYNTQEPTSNTETSSVSMDTLKNNVETLSNNIDKLTNEIQSERFARR